MVNIERGGDIDSVFDDLNNNPEIRKKLDDEKIAVIVRKALDIMNKLNHRQSKESAEMFYDLPPIAVAKLIHEFTRDKLIDLVAAGEKEKVQEFEEFLAKVAEWLDKTSYADDLPDNEEIF